MTIDPKTGIGEVIIIKALEKGYYRTDMFMTQEEVDEQNILVGAGTKNVAQAMESASMWGWDCYLNCLKSFDKIANE
ncbi:MAG: hypothetical protein WA061_01660 [Microgenomates group bacterium]